MGYYKATVVRNNAKEIDLVGFCGIIANTFTEAVIELETQLKMNPGRSMYYDMWVASGRPVLCCLNAESDPYRLLFADRIS